MQHKKSLVPFRWFVVSMTALATAHAWAASVQSVTGSMQGGGEVVRIELSEPLAQPVTGFSIQSPATSFFPLLYTLNIYPMSSPIAKQFIR